MDPIYMIAQDQPGGKAFTTLFTLKHFGSISVNKAMILQIWFRYKCFATLFTLVWFITCMPPDVNGQVILLYKRLRTKVAFIRFFSCMNPNMTQQSKLREKPSLTYITLKRSLTIMAADMNFQPRLSAKFFSTLWTWIPFRIRIMCS
jgi:hypothetical protein